MQPLSDERSDDQRERERDFVNENKALQDREDRSEEPDTGGGAEKPKQDKLPGMPSKDDPSPVGDTDQHSPG